MMCAKFYDNQLIQPIMMKHARFSRVRLHTCTRAHTHTHTHTHIKNKQIHIHINNNKKLTVSPLI